MPLKLAVLLFAFVITPTLMLNVESLIIYVLFLLYLFKQAFEIRVRNRSTGVFCVVVARIKNK